MRLMFWVLAAGSVVLAVLAMIPAVVVLSTLTTGFLMAPVWLVAANLWWVMGLAAPVVWYRERGRTGFGTAVSIGLAVVVAGGFYGLRSLALARIEAPFASTAGALAGQDDVSVVDLVVKADGVLGEAACDALCERLLTGATVTTVRRIVDVDNGRAIAHVFRRLDPAQCLALDPEFPIAEPCLLLVADDGLATDLRVTVDGSGDGYASRDEVGGLAYLVSARRVRVEDLRAGEAVLLHDQSTRTWFEAVAPVPLIANSGFDGNGLHGGGLAPPRLRKSDPPLGVAGILEGLGLSLGPGRPFVETEPGLNIGGRITLAPKGYFEAQPYDTALIASILNRGDDLDEGIVAQIGDWLKRLERTTDATGTTRALIGRLPDVLGAQAIMLQGLSLKRPELFVEQFADFYRQVQSGNDEASRVAANAILDKVRGDPFGTHDAEAEAFLAALRSGKQRDYLIQVVGRYGFDPTPILQGYLEQPDTDEDRPGIYTIFHAACMSDPKWNGTLGPLLHGQMIPLLDDLYRNRDAVEIGSRALRRLDRADLVHDLMDRVDWDVFMVRMRDDYGSPRTLEQTRMDFFGREEIPDRC